MITDDALKRVLLMVISILVLAFQGFWLAGAYFFSDGRDVSVQMAIGLWWVAFSVLCCSGDGPRLPA